MNDNIKKLKLITYTTIISFVYLYSRELIPIDIFYAAIHDDGWFIRGAQNIGNYGHSYSQFTLIKGPAYVVFLAITALSGVSLQITTAILHVFAAYLFSYNTSKLIKNQYIFYILFIIALIIQYPLQRVVRDEFSEAVLLIALSIMIGLFIEKNKKYFLKTGIIGILCGIVVITREDGFLTVLPLMLTPLFFLFDKRLSKKLLIIILLIEFFMMISVIQINKFINYSIHGSYVGVELVDSDYVGALNSIYRIRENPIQEYLEVTDENLNSLYSISPTLRHLKVYLDETGWRGQSCQFELSTCGKLGTGYFMWALRDAMAENGFYKTPSTAKEAYRNISVEIDDACLLKKIKCANKYLSNLPNFELLKITSFIYRIKKAIFVSLKIPRLSLGVSRVTSEQEKAAAYYLNISNYLFKPENINYYQVTGWYWNPKEPTDWLDISLIQGDKITPVPKVSRIRSDDIAVHFGNSFAKNQRFQIYLPCHEEDCNLKINRKNLDAVSNLKSDKEYKVNDGIFHIDSIYNPKNAYINHILENKKSINIKILNYINEIYNELSLYIFIFGNIAFLLILTIALNRKILDRSVILTGSLWLLYYSKIFFLALVTSLWIPQGINHLYLYPAIVFLPLASILSISILLQYLLLTINNSNNELHKVING